MKNFESKLNEAMSNADPPVGHQQRFENRLKAEFNSGKSVRLRLIGYAASFVFLATIAAFLLINNNSEKLNYSLVISTDEFIESEQYYQTLVDEKIQNLKGLEYDVSEYLADLEGFDKSLETLKKDLNEAPGDERIIEAILNTYVIKIESIDNIYNILKNIS